MKSKDYRILAVVGILLLAGVFSGAFSDFLSGFVDERVTWADYQEGCTLAEELVRTIKCEGVGTGTNSLVVWTKGFDPDMKLPGGLPIPSESIPRVSFFVPNSVPQTAKIAGLSRFGGGFCQKPESFVIREAGSEFPLCVSSLEAGCVGVTLQPNTEYVVYEQRDADLFSGIWCDNSYKVTISWQNVHLTVSDAMGRNGVGIPGTLACIDNWEHVVTEASSEAYKSVDGKEGGEPLMSSDYLESEVVGDVHGDKKKGFKWGQTAVLHMAYQTIANLVPQEYNGYVVGCDPVERKVYDYKYVGGLDYSCYAIKNKVIIDGTRKEHFCCDTSQCSAHQVCSDFECKGGKVAGTCYSDVECDRTEFNLDKDGKYYQTHGKCVVTSGDLGKCEYEWEEVECSPDGGPYYDDDGELLQCKRSANGWVLGKWDNPLSECSTRGANACCLEGNQYYTIQEAPEGLLCCSPGGGLAEDSESKLGYVDAQCKSSGEEGGFGSWLNNLFGGSGGLGGLGIIGLIIIVIIVFIIIIIIIK